MDRKVTGQLVAAWFEDDNTWATAKDNQIVNHVQDGWWNYPFESSYDLGDILKDQVNIKVQWI